ncbi:hypothetical protein ACHAQJ_000316 [Trichoderma viride]
MNRISDAITQDHRELESYYNRIISSSSPDEQTRYQNLFVWELARHSIGEELVVKEQLYKFQKLSVDDAEFLPTLHNLYADLKQHMEEEENDDLPKLEQAMDPEKSESLAKSFSRTKKFVPTQSHPSAPDKPPFETVVGLLSAPIDKLMDAFKRFPKD